MQKEKRRIWTFTRSFLETDNYLKIYMSPITPFITSVVQTFASFSIFRISAGR